MDRKLDGYYFRVQRNGKWESVCFSDLTDEERDGVLKGRDEQWLISMVKGLASTIRTIGDQLDLMGG